MILAITANTLSHAQKITVVSYGKMKKKRDDSLETMFILIRRAYDLEYNLKLRNESVFDLRIISKPILPKNSRSMPCGWGDRHFEDTVKQGLSFAENQWIVFWDICGLARKNDTRPSCYHKLSSKSANY